MRMGGSPQGAIRMYIRSEMCKVRQLSRLSYVWPVQAAMRDVSKQLQQKYRSIPVRVVQPSHMQLTMDLVKLGQQALIINTAPQGIWRMSGELSWRALLQRADADYKRQLAQRGAVVGEQCRAGADLDTRYKQNKHVKQTEMARKWRSWYELSRRSPGGSGPGASKIIV